MRKICNGGIAAGSESGVAVAVARPLAFVLLGMVGALGPDITPSPYWPDLDHYIPRYVLLALSVGLGVAAIGSPQRIDKVFGIAVVVAGGWMVVYIIAECIRIIRR